jgi:hypothetical protein
MQRKRERHDTQCTGLTGGAAGHPRACGSASSDEGAQPQRGNDLDPGCIEHRGSRRHLPACDTPRLLDESDSDAPFNQGSRHCLEIR